MDDSKTMGRAVTIGVGSFGANGFVIDDVADDIPNDCQAALFDPRLPPTKKGQRGRRAQKGPRLPSPKAAAAKADRKRSTARDWLWQEVTVTVYGCPRQLRAFAYEAVWPRVLGLRPVPIVVVLEWAGADGAAQGGIRGGAGLCGALVAGGRARHGIPMAASEWGRSYLGWLRY